MDWGRVRIFFWDPLNLLKTCLLMSGYLRRSLESQSLLSLWTSPVFCPIESSCIYFPKPNHFSSAQPVQQALLGFSCLHCGLWSKACCLCFLLSGSLFYAACCPVSQNLLQIFFCSVFWSLKTSTLHPCYSAMADRLEGCVLFIRISQSRNSEFSFWNMKAFLLCPGLSSFSLLLQVQKCCFFVTSVWENCVQKCGGLVVLSVSCFTGVDLRDNLQK